jgi:hypothetical protein
MPKKKSDPMQTKISESIPKKKLKKILKSPEKIPKKKKRLTLLELLMQDEAKKSNENNIELKIKNSPTKKHPLKQISSSPDKILKTTSP